MVGRLVGCPNGLERSRGVERVEFYDPEKLEIVRVVGNKATIATR